MPVFYCAIIPTTPHRASVACEGEGIVVSSVECVYTLAHAVGFVTRSLHDVRWFAEANYGGIGRQRREKERKKIECDGIRR